MNTEKVAPGITIYREFLTNSQDYIDRAETVLAWNKGTITQDGIDYRISHISSMFNHPGKNENEDILKGKIRELGNLYALENDLPKPNMQGLQLIRYQPGTGFYNWHYDASYFESDNDEMKRRAFSLVLYLNDVEDGGETEFKNFDLKIKPEAGTALMFPANYVYLHRANQPKSNAKYIIVTWFDY